MSPDKPISIAVVGATGMVGREFLEILEDRKIPISSLRLFDSDELLGQTIPFHEKHHRLEALKAGCFDGVQIAFFCAGSEVAAKWAPKAVGEGCHVVDNSDAFRMRDEIPLLIPEVNPKLIPERTNPTLMASPNCGVVQLCVALNPLQEKFGIASIEVATYQSVSGMGSEGIAELSQHTTALLNGRQAPAKVFPHTIAFNNVPQIGEFDSNGFTTEETQIAEETQKIFGMPNLPVSVTCVRTPTFNGHSQAVWVTLDSVTDRKTLIDLLNSAPGLEVQDDPSENSYPLNRDVTKQDPVFVGRIRQDRFNSKRWLMWVVADNIRKGASLNALQIAEKIFGIS